MERACHSNDYDSLVHLPLLDYGDAIDYQLTEADYHKTFAPHENAMDMKNGYPNFI